MSKVNTNWKIRFKLQAPSRKLSIYFVSPQPNFPQPYTTTCSCPTEKLIVFWPCCPVSCLCTVSYAVLFF